MTLFLWIIIFILSLAVLIKAADIFTDNSERLGIALGIPAFIVGLTIVSIGTSLPELSTSLVAVFKNATPIVTANAIGSNVANILLVIGVSAILAKMLKVERDLINLDLPLLVGTMLLLLFIVMDKKIVLAESLILIAGYIIYIFYTVSYKEKPTEEIITPREVVKEIKGEKRKRNLWREILDIGRVIIGRKKKEPLLTWQTVFLIVLSGFFIYLGAKYVIESLIEMASILHIGSAAIAMSVLAVGTSLPELIVSATAILKGKHEIGVGNVVGSNIFNSFVIIGLPGLFSTLVIDEKTLFIGIPFMLAATLLFVFSGISKKIYNWEGMIYLLIFVLFIAKLFDLF